MILLIEDKYQRQFRSLNIAGIALKEYSTIIEDGTRDRYEAIFEALKDDSFDFSRYAFIIAHMSAFGEENSQVLHTLTTGCKKHQIQLVLFSGGIDAIYHDSQTTYANINSKLLYSNNLKLFLEDAKKNKPNILILLYGENWKLNIALGVLEKINLFIQSHEEDRVFYKRFISKTSLENIENFLKNIYKPKMDDKKYTNLNEIQKLADNLKENIKRMIDG